MNVALFGAAVGGSMWLFLAWLYRKRHRVAAGCIVCALVCVVLGVLAVT